MTEEEERQLNIFEARFRHFLYQYDVLKQQNETLRQELLQKEGEIKALEARCQQNRNRVCQFESSRIISINDNESRDTKQRLARLVREIDKCIALLNG